MLGHSKIFCSFPGIRTRALKTWNSNRLTATLRCLSNLQKYKYYKKQ